MTYFKTNVTFDVIKFINLCKKVNEIQKNMFVLSEIFNPVKKDILNYTGGNELNISGIWYNEYAKGYGTPMHKHDGDGLPETSDYTIIVFISVANENEEFFIEDETINPKTGDVYVVPNTVGHGLKPVNDTLYALMFKLDK